MLSTRGVMSNDEGQLQRIADLRKLTQHSARFEKKRNKHGPKKLLDDTGQYFRQPPAEVLEPG